jgi:hypothetical protein
VFAGSTSAEVLKLSLGLILSAAAESVLAEWSLIYMCFSARAALLSNVV